MTVKDSMMMVKLKDELCSIMLDEFRAKGSLSSLNPNLVLCNSDLQYSNEVLIPLIIKIQDGNVIDRLTMFNYLANSTDHLLLKIVDDHFCFKASYNGNSIYLLQREGMESLDPETRLPLQLPMPTTTIRSSDLIIDYPYYSNNDGRIYLPIVPYDNRYLVDDIDDKFSLDFSSIAMYWMNKDSKYLIDITSSLIYDNMIQLYLSMEVEVPEELKDLNFYDQQLSHSSTFDSYLLNLEPRIYKNLYALIANERLDDDKFLIVNSIHRGSPLMKCLIVGPHEIIEIV